MQVPRRRILLTYIASLLLFGAAAFRMIPQFWGTPSRWYINGLLAAYLALLLVERPISSRWRPFVYIYFVLSTLVAMALPLFGDDLDYYALLFIPLCMQAIWYLPQRAATFWIVGFMVCLALSMQVYFPGLQGLAFTLIYVAASFFITVFGIATLQAEKARAESQALLGELQVANRKLRAYAAQAQEMAAAQERNRLARELHDSVTQTIFSMTLTAQAARILLDRDPTRVAGELEHLQLLAQGALAEMRGLIRQLRPRTISEEGLCEALRRHAAERASADGLAVDLTLNGEARLPAEIEEGLFRVVQEALNNVVKHAGTDKAWVTLDIDATSVRLLVEDRGAGFDPRSLHAAPEHIGLASMAERVQALGGRLAIESQPGAGARVRVEIERREEPAHA